MFLLTLFVTGTACMTSGFGMRDPSPVYMSRGHIHAMIRQMKMKNQNM